MLVPLQNAVHEQQPSRAVFLFEQLRFSVGSGFNYTTPCFSAPLQMYGCCMHNVAKILECPACSGVPSCLAACRSPCSATRDCGHRCYCSCPRGVWQLNWDRADVPVLYLIFCNKKHMNGENSFYCLSLVL